MSKVEPGNNTVKISYLVIKITILNHIIYLDFEINIKVVFKARI